MEPTARAPTARAPTARAPTARAPTARAPTARARVGPSVSSCPAPITTSAGSLPVLLSLLGDGRGTFCPVDDISRSYWSCVPAITK